MMIIMVTGPLDLLCLSFKLFYNYSFIFTLNSLAFFLKMYYSKINKLVIRGQFLLLWQQFRENCHLCNVSSKK